MATDIISKLNIKDLDEFKKDFTELIRIYYGINEEYSKLSKNVDKYINEFKQAVNLFNKKYKNLMIRLKQTTEELQLRIFIREKNVKDIFINVASKLDGLKAIGVNNFDTASIEETDKFSKELDKAKNKIFISYHEKEAGLSTILLESYKKGIIELHYSEGIANETSPEFKLCSYYAVKDGIKKINVHERLSAFGFVEMPLLEKVRNFFKKFNPRMEE